MAPEGKVAGGAPEFAWDKPERLPVQPTDKVDLRLRGKGAWSSVVPDSFSRGDLVLLCSTPEQTGKKSSLWRGAERTMKHAISGGKAERE